MPSKNSPNWNWLKLGAVIKRNGFRRTIMVNGKIVCVNAGYDMELAISSWLLNPCPLS